MGYSDDYTCPSCNYAVHICGGREVGMFAVLKTKACKAESNPYQGMDWIPRSSSSGKSFRGMTLPGMTYA